MTMSGGSFALAPWQMWGQTVSVSPVFRPASMLSEQVQISTQIAKVNYKRPETWSFFFGGKIIGGTVSPIDPVVVRVQFHLILGVGRSSFRTAQGPYAIHDVGFALFSWIVPAGSQPGSSTTNNTKYTTQVQTPELEDGALVPVRHLISQFPAEDIQIYADVGIIAGDVGTRIDLELTGYLAPANHVRPEWFDYEEGRQQFRGNETGGT